jgi:hypothetical protein
LADAAEAEILRKKGSSAEQLGLLEAEMHLEMSKPLPEDPNRDDQAWKMSTRRYACVSCWREIDWALWNMK